MTDPTTVPTRRADADSRQSDGGGRHRGARAAGRRPAQHYSLFGRLQRGEVNFDFIGRRKLWYTISGDIVLISLVSLIFRGFTLGIDFKGGDTWQFKTNGHTTPTRSGC